MKLKFEIWQGEFRQTCMGYKHGTGMRKIWEGEIAGQADDETVLDRIFHDFQRVDENHMPPDEYQGRSLSFGDLIRLGDHWHAVDVIGFQRLFGEPIENAHAYVNAVLCS